MTEEGFETTALPGMARTGHAVTPLSRTRQMAETALEDVRQQLADLRGQRADINDAIRELVLEEKVLTSMVRVATKEVSGEGE